MRPDFMRPDMYMVYPYNQLHIRKLLDRLKEAMKDERLNHKKYRMMMEMTDNREVRDNLRYAYEDEAKHYRMLQEIYEDLTGEKIEIPVPKVKLADRFIDNVKNSLQEELKSVELYRDIRAMLDSTKHRDMIFEIITDEREHATRLVFIYAMIK